jgi:hypothetical protein
MLISKSDLAMTASHELEASTMRHLRLAQGEPRGDSAFAKLLERRMSSPPPQLLTIETAAPNEASAPDGNPFEAIVEMLFGLARQPDRMPRLDSGFGGRSIQMMEFVHTSETERCSFAASGNVCLADGSTRQFNVGYEMERSEETNSFGVASFRDPLMLDFAQPTTKLSPHSVEFDLDADGKAERMRMPGSNTAVLFNDINHNGKADDGSELFGPQSGDGFADLAKLDDDGNGWIDEGDKAFADLKLWQIGDDGVSTVRSLADAGIGALATLSEATPFTLKENGEAVGQVRASSVWLGEEGGAGIVRQVDVATEEIDAETSNA